MSKQQLQEAIKGRKSIRFSYNKVGKNPGDRFGDPHALFVFTTKAGVENVKIHIAQTGGVSDSGTPFPSFRLFDVNDLTVHAVLDGEPCFVTHPDYNPAWDGYANV